MSDRTPVLPAAASHGYLGLPDGELSALPPSLVHRGTSNGAPAPPPGHNGAMERWYPDRPARPGIRRRASAHRAGARWLDRALEGRTVAIVLGVLAALGLVGATLTFVVDLFVAPWRVYGADVEESLHLLASAIGLAAAFQLSRGAHRAKLLVLAGLALNVGATLAFSRGSLGRFEVIVPLLTWLGLAALTVAARVRDS